MSYSVRPKKHLGQHFLKDNSIAERIAQSLTEETDIVIEVGPGTGALTQFLLHLNEKLWLCEVDRESIHYLQSVYPFLSGRIVQESFLELDLTRFGNSITIIGNFPYNISSQILFHALDYKDSVRSVVGMFQKEVAERVASPPGSKAYGILSVLLQAFYNIEYLFTVDEHVFHPPPKVKSGVIRLVRNDVKELSCPHDAFIKLVKAGFNQRRKTLRNAWKSLTFEPLPEELEKFFSLRAEQLSVQDFENLAKYLRSK